MCGFQYHGCFTNCSSWKKILNIWKLPIQNKNCIFLYICLSFKKHNNLKNNNYKAFFKHFSSVNNPQSSPRNIFLEKIYNYLQCTLINLRIATINMIHSYSQSEDKRWTPQLLTRKNLAFIACT